MWKRCTRLQHAGHHWLNPRVYSVHALSSVFRGSSAASNLFHNNGEEEQTDASSNVNIKTFW